MGKLTRENARKVDGYFYDIDTAIRVLTEYRDKGQSVYIDFNDHLLYSCDVTVERAYQEIYGMSREEVIQKEEEELMYYRDKRERKSKKEIQDLLKELIAIGKENLDERIFCEQVLTILEKMKDFTFTDETYEELKTALKEIGCVGYNTWTKQKTMAGEKVDSDIGAYNAESIAAAIYYISHFLYPFEYFQGELKTLQTNNYIRRWLECSKALRDREDKKSTAEDPYIEVLKLSNERREAMKAINKERHNDIKE